MWNMTQRSMPDGQPRSDKKVLAIATAAARQFGAKGYIATSLEDIAAAARMSKGAMYHYFNSKCDILNFILSTFMDLVLDNAEQDLKKMNDPVERIRIIILRHVKTYTDNPDLAKTLLNEAHNLSPAKLKKIKTKQRKYFAIVAEAISSSLGEANDKDRVTVLTFSLLGMCNWIYAWYNPKGAISPEELSQMMFENFTRSWKEQ
jgi:AcrR family transcriptional regulator